ncbi:DUF6702 family protein [Gangjinia marincola]|uniref:DUF6702 family protein n=1 Tax=Gangjinia marincola TaxID=578463 RepID=UPI0031D2868D
MKKTLLPVFFLFIVSSFTAHKFYVSLTEIEYVEEKKMLQIISKVFLDDIEAVLGQRYEEEVSFTKDETSNASAERLLVRYYTQKLQLKVDDKDVTLNYIGSEIEADQLVVYLEVNKVNPFSAIRITNHVLMDLFEDQQNIVHVTARGTTKSMMAVQERESQLLKFR